MYICEEAIDVHVLGSAIHKEQKIPTLSQAVSQQAVTSTFTTEPPHQSRH